MRRMPGVGRLLHGRARGRMRPARADERGQAALLTAGIMVFLATIGLLAANVGVLIATRTAVQRAADAAVLAGCAELPNLTAANAVAVDYGAVKNAGTSTTHLQSGNVVTTSSPPSANLPNDTFRVTVQRSAPLIGPFSLGSGMIGASGTCRRGEGPRPALHALTGTLSIGSGANVQLGNTGLLASGGGSCPLVVGSGASVSGRFIDTNNGLACVDGTVNPAVRQAPPGYPADPYGSVPQPSQTGYVVDIGPFTLTVPPVVGALVPDPRPNCLYPPLSLPPPYNAITSTAAAVPNHCFVNTNAELEPGMYWGGLELGDPGGNPVTITLKPGIYYLAGGGLAGFDGGLHIHPNTTVTGNGVIIYNGEDPWAVVGQRACGRVFISPTAQVLLTPPGPGSVYHELLLFQERTCTEAAFIEGAVLGQVNAPGVVYAPTVPVWLKLDNVIHGAVVAASIQVLNLVIFDAVIPSGTLWHGPLQLIE